GRFETRKYDAAPTPNYLAAADFNNDEWTDLFSVNQAARGFSVVLNNGAGALVTTEKIEISHAPQDVKAFDLNADGKLDLVTANIESEEGLAERRSLRHDAGGFVHVFFGDGAGKFVENRVYGAGEMPSEIVVGDLNGDMQPDLALTDRAENVVRLYFNSNGNFDRRSAIPTGGTHPISLKIGDFNRDGKPDFVVANRNSNNVSILLGNGNETFAAATTIAVGNRPLSIETADFNRDGKADFATANSTSDTISLFPGNGDGTFGAAVNLPAGTFPAFVKASDINRDSIADLLVVNGGVNAPGITIFKGNGDGTFQNASSIRFGNLLKSLDAADFNSDGSPDLSVVDSDRSAVWRLYGDGTGAFGNPIAYGVGLFPLAVIAADADNDGKTDLVSANAGSSSLSLLLNKCAE
ncbi:MAG TPA: VCBS repeat-containing protein, partial [Pyrinomonadaceae bacterium]